MAEQTEQPTRRRLRRALAEGDSPISRRLVGAAALAAVVIVSPWAIDALVAAVHEWLVRALDPRGRAPGPVSVLQMTAILLAALAATAAVPALIAGLAQTGGVVHAPSRARSARRQAGQRAFEAVSSVLWTVGLVIGGALVLWTHRVDVVRVAGRLDAALTLTRALGFETARMAAAVVLLFAIVDRVASGVFWVRRHRMSRHDKRLEERASEGDPEIRRKRRIAHEALAREAKPIKSQPH